MVQNLITQRVRSTASTLYRYLKVEVVSSLWSGCDNAMPDERRPKDLNANGLFGPISNPKYKLNLTVALLSEILVLT